MIDRSRPVLAFLLVLNSAALFIIWAAVLAEGPFERGLMAYQPVGTIPGLYALADLLTAVVVIAGAAGLWAGARWADKVTLLGLGMFIYSAIDSLGWCLHTHPVMALPKASILIIGAMVIPKLVQGYFGDDEEEEALRRPAPRRRD